MTVAQGNRGATMVISFGQWAATLPRTTDDGHLDDVHFIGEKGQAVTAISLNDIAAHINAENEKKQEQQPTGAEGALLGMAAVARLNKPVTRRFWKFW